MSKHRPQPSYSFSIETTLQTLIETLSEKSFWVMLLLGFSAGLPILLVFGTLTLWLNEAGVSKSTITYFSWAGLGYGFKFVWAPLIDQARIPLLTTWLGKRRSWLLLCQSLLLLILVAMALTNPIAHNYSLTLMAVFAVALGFTSASQDIVIDAYRIEITPPHLMAMSASTYTLGYRLAMIMAGAMALILSQKLGSSLGEYHYLAWQKTYLIMAAFMLIGIMTTLIIAEPTQNKAALDASGSQQLLLLFVILLIPFIIIYTWWEPAIGYVFHLEDLSPFGAFLITILRFSTAVIVCYVVARLLINYNVVSTDIAATAYWSPVKEFIQRYPLKLIILLMLLIGFYRISDMVLGVVANMFYQDLGFNKADIAYASKVFGVIMTLLGTFIGGFIAIRIGVMGIMMWGAILSAATNLLFMILSAVGSQLWLLYLVIIADNIAGGIATIAFITFLSRLSNVKFTAMQYAIFSSIMILLPRLVSGYSGSIVDASNYSVFFFITTLMGIPVIILVWLVGKQLTFDEDKR